MARVPAPMEVRTLLEELLGRSVEVSPCAPWAPTGGEVATIALYVDDRAVVRSVGVADLPFSAHAGAAIGLLPPGVADDVVEEQGVPEALRENLYEVLNICAALQNLDDAPHVRLHEVYHVGQPVPPEVPALATVLGQRLDLSVKVAGYGEGRLSFVGVG